MFWTISSILTLSLSIQVPLSTLSGRVMDERNTAVGKIAVQLLRKLYEPDGRLRFQIIQTAITNAEGEYRFVSLGSDRYYVRTSALISATSRNPNNSSPSPQAYASTYYPATTNEILALPVEVTADSDVQNIDILVSRSRLVNIRGRMTDGIRLRQPYLCWVFLVSAQDNDSPAGGSKLECNDDGTFEFRDVIPGRYYVIGRRIDDAADRADAVEVLDVHDSDIDNVNLVSTLGSSIFGQVRVNASRAPEIQITLTPIEDLKFISTRRVTSNPLGKFMVPTLPLGRYRLSIAGVPPGYYVKSAMVDKTDILSEGLAVQGKVSSELVISLSSSGGQISGIVRSTTKNFANGSVVTLVPASDDRPDAYQVTSTDPDGRFAFTGIAPGDYHIYAWDRLASQEYYSSERFTGLGQLIRIKDGDRLAIDLREIQTNP